MRVAIIGSGFSGLGMGIALKREGLADFTIYDRAEGVGGTWRHNTYPGLACDVPSHLYSFSFEPKRDWSKRFSPREEIADYLENCARRYGLEPHLRLHTEVTRMAFDGATRRWRLELDHGTTDEADVVVTATGQLIRPAIPSLP